MKNSNRRSRTVSSRGVVAAAFFISFAIGLPLVGASTASADFIGDLITIEVDSIHGHGSVLFNPHIPDHAREKVQAAMERRAVHGNGGELLGTIESLIIDFDGDPLVDIAFTATAGSADTTFTITSALVNFDELADPVGMASASLELTDVVGSTAGAFLGPVGSATGMYRAEYNGGDLFQELVGGFGFNAPGGTVGNGSAYGPVTIPGAVVSIQGKLAFTLSAGDQASGSTRFEVTAVPEPTTWAMMAMAAIGLFVCGRRWRRI